VFVCVCVCVCVFVCVCVCVCVSVYKLPKFSTFLPGHLCVCVYIYIFIYYWVNSTIVIRLTHSEEIKDTFCCRLLEVGWLKDMWRPDSFFKNAKSVTFQTMTIPNHYLWLYKDKTILYMVKWVKQTFFFPKAVTVFWNLSQRDCEWNGQVACYASATGNGINNGSVPSFILVASH
jgi:hypothetical protein